MGWPRRERSNRAVARRGRGRWRVCCGATVYATAHLLWTVSRGTLGFRLEWIQTRIIESVRADPPAPRRPGLASSRGAFECGRCTILVCELRTAHTSSQPSATLRRHDNALPATMAQRTAVKRRRSPTAMPPSGAATQCCPPSGIVNHRRRAQSNEIVTRKTSCSITAAAVPHMIHMRALAIAIRRKLLLTYLQKSFEGAHNCA